MMRGVSTWAVAVRTPEGQIEVESEALSPWAKRHRIWRVPILRGVVALAESMKIGFRALAISANAQIEDDEDGEPEEIGGWVWGLTIAFSLVLAIGLFFVVPVGLTSLIKGQLGSPGPLLAGRGRPAHRHLPRLHLGDQQNARPAADLRVPRRRAQDDLLLRGRRRADARSGRSSTRASIPRCGTSFLLIVMVLSIFIFAPLGLPAWYWLVISRIVGIPVVAGLSYEVIKWAGKNRRKAWVRAVMWPGLMLQNLTTREPDLDQLAVAIASLNAVLAREKPEDLRSEQTIEIVA